MQRAMSATHRFIYKATNGRVGGRMRRGRVLLLTTIGRRSGEKRTLPLIYVNDGDALVVIASNGGRPRHPTWFLNLQAHPEAEVRIGPETRRVRFRVAEGADRERLWSRAVEVYPGYETYRKRTDRQIPVVVLDPIDATSSGAEASN